MALTGRTVVPSRGCEARGKEQVIGSGRVVEEIAGRVEGRNSGLRGRPERRCRLRRSKPSRGPDECAVQVRGERTASGRAGGTWSAPASVAAVGTGVGDAVGVGVGMGRPPEPGGANRQSASAPTATTTHRRRRPRASRSLDMSRFLSAARSGRAAVRVVSRRLRRTAGPSLGRAGSVPPGEEMAPSSRRSRPRWRGHAVRPPRAAVGSARASASRAARRASMA